MNCALSALSWGPCLERTFVGPRSGPPCQETGPVNWRKRRILRRIHRGGTLTGGCAAHAAIQDGESPDRSMSGMFGIAGRFRGSPMLSTKLAFEFATECMAPHTGRVSNFRGSVSPLIEPADVHCFQNDSIAPPTLVQGGHPPWISLELAKGPRNFRWPQSARIALPFATFGELTASLRKEPVDGQSMVDDKRQTGLIMVYFLDRAPIHKALPCSPGSEARFACCGATKSK